MRLALAYISRHLAYIASISVGIAAICTSCIILIALHAGWNSAISEAFTATGATHWIISSQSQSLIDSGGYLSESQISKILNSPSGTNAEPILAAPATLEKEGRLDQLLIIGRESDATLAKPARILQGTATTNPGQVVLDQDIARQQQIQLGDTIQISHKDLEVVGISDKTNLVIVGIAYAHINDTEELSNREGLRSAVAINTKKSSDAEQFASELGLNVVASEDFAASHRKLTTDKFLPIIFGIVIMLTITGVIMLGGASYQLVVAQYAQIAILKALGAHDRMIWSTMAWLSGSITVIGLVIATPGVLLANQLLSMIAPGFVVEFLVRDSIVIIFTALTIATLVTIPPLHRLRKVDAASSLIKGAQ